MNLTDRHIDLFIKYSRIPIPINDPAHIEYYIDLFDEHYDSKAKFDIFKNCCFAHDLLDDYKKTIREKNDKIIATYKPGGEKHELITKFKDFNFEEKFGKIKNKVLLDKSSKKGIYIEENANNNQQFVSIDLKSANFLTIINHDNNIFNGFDDWTTFMTDQGCDEFIASSKQFREVFFGEIKTCKKSHGIYKHYLDDVYEFIKEKYEYTDDDVVCISEDEIVLKYKDSLCANAIKRQFPNMFNVDIFTLEKKSKYPYYIKHIEQDTCIKQVIKCVPKKFIAQFIKLIKNEKIVDNDLKFIDEKQIAKYENPLFQIEKIEILKKETEILEEKHKIFIEEYHKYAEEVDKAVEENKKK